MFTSDFQAYLNKHATKEMQGLLVLAISSRGKGKGYVLNTAPNGSKKPKHNAVWNAVMLTLAPVRAQMCNMTFMNSEDRKVFDEVEKWCTFHKFAVNIFMQKPFQFNVFAHRYDTEKAKTELMKIAATI